MTVGLEANCSRWEAFENQGLTTSKTLFVFLCILHFYICPWTQETTYLYIVTIDLFSFYIDEIKQYVLSECVYVCVYCVCVFILHNVRLIHEFIHINSFLFLSSYNDHIFIHRSH